MEDRQVVSPQTMPTDPFEQRRRMWLVAVDDLARAIGADRKAVIALLAESRNAAAFRDIHAWAEAADFVAVSAAEAELPGWR